MGSKDFNYIQLKFNDHLEASFNNLAVLRDKQVFTDLILTCCGQFYPAHRLVVSSCSKYLARSLQSIPAFCLYPIILLDGLSNSTLEVLLTFMYDGLVTVHRDHLPEVLEAGQRLGIKGLAQVSGTEETSVIQPTDRAAPYSKVPSNGATQSRRASSGAAATTTTTTTKTAAAAPSQTLTSNTKSEDLVSALQAPHGKEETPSQADTMTQLIKPFAAEGKATTNRSNEITSKKNSKRRSFDEALYPEAEIVMSHAHSRKFLEKTSTVDKRGREDFTKDGSCHKRTKLSEPIGVKPMAANNSSAPALNLALTPPTSRGSPRRQVKITNYQVTERKKGASNLKGQAPLEDTARKHALEVTMHTPCRKPIQTPTELELSRDQSAFRKSPRILNSPLKAANSTIFRKTLGESTSSLDVAKGGSSISGYVDDGASNLQKPDKKLIDLNCEAVLVEKDVERIANVTAEFGEVEPTQKKKPPPPCGTGDVKEDNDLEKSEQVTSLKNVGPENTSLTDVILLGRAKDANVRRIVRTMAPVVRKMTSSSLMEAVAADPMNRAHSGQTEEPVALTKTLPSLDRHARKKKKKKKISVGRSDTSANVGASIQQLPVRMETEDESEMAEIGAKHVSELERVGPSNFLLSDLVCGEAVEELDMLDPDEDEDDSDPASSSFEGWSSPKFINPSTKLQSSSGTHRPKNVYGGRGALLKTREGRPHRRRATATKTSNPYAKAYHRISAKSTLHYAASGEDGSLIVNGAMEVDKTSILSAARPSDQNMDVQNESVDPKPLDSTALSSLSTKNLLSAISKSVVISQAPTNVLSESSTSNANIKTDDVRGSSSISSASDDLTEKISDSQPLRQTTHGAKLSEFKGAHISPGISESTGGFSKHKASVAEPMDETSVFASPKSQMMRAQQALQHCKSISVTRTPPSKARTELVSRRSNVCPDPSLSQSINKNKKKKRRVDPTVAPLDRKLVDPVQSAVNIGKHKPSLENEKASVSALPAMEAGRSARSVTASFQPTPGAPVNVLQSVGSHLRLQSAGPSGLASALITSGSAHKNIKFDDPSLRRCIIRRVQASEVLSLLGARSSVTISAASPSSGTTSSGYSSQRVASSVPPSRVTPVSIGGFTLPVSSSVILVPKLSSVSSAISTPTVPTPTASTPSSEKQTLLSAVVDPAAAFSPTSTSCNLSGPATTVSQTLPTTGILQSLLLTTSAASCTTVSIAKSTRSVACTSSTSTLPSTSFARKQETGFLGSNATAGLTSPSPILSNKAPTVKPATSYRAIRPAGFLPYRTTKPANDSQSTKVLMTSPTGKPSAVAAKALITVASESDKVAPFPNASLPSPGAVTFTTSSGTRCVVSRSPSTLVAQRALLSTRAATDTFSAVAVTAPIVTQTLPLSVIAQPVIASVISERQSLLVPTQSALTCHASKSSPASYSVESVTPPSSARSVPAASIVKPTAAVRHTTPVTSLTTTAPSTLGTPHRQRPILPQPSEASEAQKNSYFTLPANTTADTTSPATLTSTADTTASSPLAMTSTSTTLSLPSEPHISSATVAIDTTATSPSSSVSPVPIEFSSAPERTQRDASRTNAPPAGAAQPPPQPKTPESKLAGVQARSQRTMMCKTCRAAFTDPSELLHHTLQHQ